MKLPIIAICDGWLEVFKSKEYAERYIEPIDVENDEWEAFDADGCRLTLTVEKQSTHGFWSLFSKFEEVVRIAESEPPRAEREYVRKLIAEYVDKLRQAERHKPLVPAEALEKMPFEQLIDYVTKELR